MNFYPICIPTLNRYEHFKKCVESLANNTHAGNTELVIGLDYPPSEKYAEGYQKIKEYIPQISGFKKVTVFERTKNYGPGPNLQGLIDYCIEHYNAYILTEDDNVFSPCFLDYMNKALERFRDDDEIVSISGFNHIPFYDQGPANCYFSKNNSAWGMGLWKDKEEKFAEFLANNPRYYVDILHSPIKAFRLCKISPMKYDMLNDMIAGQKKWGDVMRSVFNIIEGKCQLVPALSLVRNEGNDGSGVNCGVAEDDTLLRQVISVEKFFNFSDEIGSCNTKDNRRNLYRELLPTDKGQRRKEIRRIWKRYKKNVNPIRRTRLFKWARNVFHRYF